MTTSNSRPLLKILLIVFHLITVNLRLPSTSLSLKRIPKEIAAAKLVQASNYPQCQLCLEKEGYHGRVSHPARSNHRIIRFEYFGQGGDSSIRPMLTFNEHCIFLDGQHRPMAISRQSFERLGYRRAVSRIFCRL